MKETGSVAAVDGVELAEAVAMGSIAEGEGGTEGVSGAGNCRETGKRVASGRLLSDPLVSGMMLVSFMAVLPKRSARRP